MGNSVLVTDGTAEVGSESGRPSYTAVWDGTNWVPQVVTAGVASGSPDSGAPVKVGGVYNATAPTLTDGDRGDLQLGTRGSANVTLFSKNSSLEISSGTPGDGSGNGTSMYRQNRQLFNGTTWDRQRANTEGTALASAARTASTDSANITNYNARGIMMFINITAASGTGGLKMRIYTIDPITGLDFAYATASTGLVATGRKMMVLYPGAQDVTSTAPDVKDLPVPRVFKLSVQHTDGSSYTYSLAYTLIV